MAYKCDRCGKGRLVSSRQRHHKGVAGGKWKHRAPRTQKISLPNLHAFNGILNGKKGHWRLCTKCLRMVKKEQRELEKKLKAKKAIKKKPARK